VSFILTAFFSLYLSLHPRLKGIVILMRPKFISPLYGVVTKKEGLFKIEAIVVIILGLAFSFTGFCPKSPI
jgi:hypothetical protein